MLTTLLLVLLAIVLTGCISGALYANRVEKAYPADVTVDVDGTQIHALTMGTRGPVVLMIHGASANAREFEWTLAPRLSEDHQVIMMDRPGHGLSERPDKAHMLATQARLAAGLLDELAPGERAIVVGHSFGGAVALRLALDHPDKVGGLVLLAPVTHDWGSGGQTWYNQLATNALIGPVFNQLVPLLGPSQVKGGIQSVFAPKPYPEDYYERSAIGLLFRPSHFRANAQDVIALREELAAQQARYPRIDVPVTVYSGAQDTVIAPRLHVGQLKHQVAGLDLVKLPEGGHMPHHAYGEEIAETVRGMSRKLQTPAPAD